MLRISSLFARLMLFFLIVMLVPVLLLAFSYVATGTRTLESNLAQQGEATIRNIAHRMQSMVESYRHKAYSISIDEGIRQLVSYDSPEKQESLNPIYERLFTIMRGDTYLATASVVSASGKVRLSTHLFPSQYDLRYQGNDTNPFFNLSRAEAGTASLITMENRYATRNNSFVFLNILRRIRDDAGQVIGYVAVDIYQDTISDISSNSGFSDIVLIDTESYTGSSLVHMDKHGDFSKFPELTSITFPLQEGSFNTGGKLVSLKAIPNTQLYLAGITDMGIYRRNVEDYVMVVALVLTIGAILAGILAYFFSKSISRPIDKLATSMHRVEEGNLETRVEESKIREIGELQRSFNTMVRQITTLMELTREEESKLQEAERKALEAQMNPHFLYNTLNTVKSIARMHDEQEIYTIITKLGKLLRDAIDNREGETTLAESFSLVENYLTIQKIRYGEKLHTIVELDETIASLKTPKLIIQPLVENAIIHGLEPKIGIWRLTVRARLEAKMVIISVADNGVGFSRNIRFKNGFSLDEANHVGLSNIQRRLKLRYGELSDLSVDSVPHEGTIVTIHIPFPRED
ncbi:cache domain-containing sensor histidine kinase [Pleomorphochaeta sp. DL1XJH-081]|uniref:cache domain-containing sensor histidine kinase n=1 Tax=Pleomorphochaeta sp. DL1XJH-081 TaxID=3409690 RepID=UPI003BB6D849